MPSILPHCLAAEGICGSHGVCVLTGCSCDFWTEGDRCQNFSWNADLLIAIGVFILLLALGCLLMGSLRWFRSMRQVEEGQKRSVVEGV
mmetsp:Transcript_2176/g.1792  ORF Transcript_2176/g.1792 Transcript_2176/m.1792 type:complete len:89 (+) Transcript_2176:52-318(+)